MFIQSGGNNGYFTRRSIHIFDHIWINSSRNEKKTSQNSREDQNTPFMFKNFFRKSCSLKDNVEEIWEAGQVTEDNMAHTHCMMDN
jgi:hypothetical protein